jgi:fructokinase
VTGSSKLLAGVELGGTKCICILGCGPHEVRAQVQVPTGEPSQTLGQVGAVLDDWRTRHGPVAALGIASFGPLDVRRGSDGYGRITSTPKPGWANTDVAGRLGGILGVPVGFGTDVEGAALAEGRWGAARGLDDFAYITVGTGVGVGLVVGGRPAGGFGHSELGHVRVVRRVGDTWPGACPFHGDCLEGLVSGPAIAARIGTSPERVAAGHPVWQSVAFALGQLLHFLVLATAPRRILMGGGVMSSRPYLFERVRAELCASLAGYRHAPELADPASYVAPPGLGTLAGPLGALALAADAAAADSSATAAALEGTAAAGRRR